MALLKSHHLPFGISTCYTSQNYKDITSEAFFDSIIDSGALFVWFFHYMPVGNDAATQLLPTPEQRTEVYHRIREYRTTKAIFSMDFQNDAEYVGGCIAGGRNYLHINAKGDVEPCVFIHYSNCNIHDTSLLDALKSPIFMRAMVKETGAVSTDYQSPESVDHLCDKTTPYAQQWENTAQTLWTGCGGCHHQ